MINISPVETPEAVEAEPFADGKYSERPPIFSFVPQMKSGSTAIGTMLGQGYGLTCATYTFYHEKVFCAVGPSIIGWGIVYVTHLEPSGANIRALGDAGLVKVVVNTRILGSCFYPPSTTSKVSQRFPGAGAFRLFQLEFGAANFKRHGRVSFYYLLAEGSGAGFGSAGSFYHIRAVPGE